MISDNRIACADEADVFAMPAHRDIVPEGLTLAPPVLWDCPEQIFKNVGNTDRGIHVRHFHLPPQPAGTMMGC